MICRCMRKTATSIGEFSFLLFISKFYLVVRVNFSTMLEVRSIELKLQIKNYKLIAIRNSSNVKNYIAKTRGQFVHYLKHSNRSEIIQHLPIDVKFTPVIGFGLKYGRLLGSILVKWILPSGR